MTDEYYQGDNSHQKRLEIKVVLPDYAGSLREKISSYLTRQKDKILQLTGLTLIDADTGYQKLNSKCCTLFQDGNLNKYILGIGGKNWVIALPVDSTLKKDDFIWLVEDICNLAYQNRGRARAAKEFGGLENMDNVHFPEGRLERIPSFVDIQLKPIVNADIINITN